MKKLILALFLLFNASTAWATLIGDEVTMTLAGELGSNGQGAGSFTGLAGIDLISSTISGNFATVITPVFTDTSIELGFSTQFLTNFWGFTPPSSITFSGLDWGGLGSISSASLFETVVDADLTGSDLTVNATSVSIDLSDVLLRNGDIVRIDIVAAHGVPEPGTLALIAFGIGGIGFYRKKPRRGKKLALEIPPWRGFLGGELSLLGRSHRSNPCTRLTAL